MKLLHDLLFTDYGLMSLIGLVFMLGMGVFFLRLFLSGEKSQSYNLPEFLHPEIFRKYVQWALLKYNFALARPASSPLTLPSSG